MLALTSGVRFEPIVQHYPPGIRAGDEAWLLDAHRGKDFRQPPLIGMLSHGALVPGVRIILTSASESRGYSAAAHNLGAAFVSKRDLSIDAVLRLLE